MLTREGFEGYGRAVRAELARLSDEAGGQPCDESLALGIALSAPAVVELAGQLLSLVGRRVHAGSLEALGSTLEAHGRGMHAGLVRAIDVAISPFVFWMSTRQRERAAQAALLAVLAIKLGTGVGAAVDSGLEGALAAMKAKEVLSGVRQLLPHLQSIA